MGVQEEMEKAAARARSSGGSTHITDDEDHPQQDMGKFANLAEERLAHNSPTDYEPDGDCGDDYKRELPERDILRP